MIENDARDLSIHAAIDHLVTNIARTNNFTRIQALERLEAFCENERDEAREAAAYARAFAHEENA